MDAAYFVNDIVHPVKNRIGQGVLSGRDMVQIHAGWNDHHQKEETGQSELQHSDCLLFVSEFLRMHQSIQ